MNGSMFRHQRDHRSWGEIALDFFQAIKSNVEYAIHEQQVKMARKAAAFVLIAAGSIFFLVGASIFVGMLINQTTWAGYLAVGIVLAIVGMLVKK